ncbi:LCP family protein [Streptomyces sp. ICBB 8177]|uniref:LCP family protein n=1 Tax=Streptomyces sp. ICBB 8177 TaxID=563922 RepID=UPI001F5439F1|nr:LCP family protein [Streptomyces sp. ICBB 8177]
MPQRSGGRHRRLRKRRLMRIAGALSLTVLTTSGLANVAMGSVGGDIGRVNVFQGLAHRPAAGAGENFLLVGTDGRDRISAREKQQYDLGGAPCHCTDTIMLAHVSADRSRLSVISIPRDTYVRLPDADGRTSRPEKINAAYSIGGPALTVSTVERMTGVHIDHYLEVDFVSFMKTVDALGGVPVCTERPLHDPKSGLNLPVGTTVLNGGQALQYVRARYVDGSADLGRMRRQQRFVAELIHKATASGLLLDPVKLGSTLGDALGSVRADPGLKPADLVDLAEAMRHFSPASAEFTSVPVANLDYPVPGIGATVTWDQPKADKLFAAIRADHPLTDTHASPAPSPSASSPGTPAAPAPAPSPTGPVRQRVEVPPGSVRVAVLGGPGAQRAADQLRATGFVVDPAPRERLRSVPRTVIEYDPRWNLSVRSLATALPGAVLRPVRHQGPVFRVLLGPDFKTVTPVEGAPPPPPADPATGVTALNGQQELCDGD